MIPEPVTITGFALGAIGFLVTIRNAVDRVLSDIDAVRTHNDTLLELRCRLEVFREVLEIWRRGWRIADRAPEALFIAFWGAEGSRDIRELLASVHRNVRKVGKEFLRKYGEVHKQSFDKAAKASSNFQQSYVQEKDESALRKLIQEWKQRSSRWKQCNTALFTGTTFLKHVDHLEKRLNTLQQYSRTHFITHCLDYREAGWEDHVQLTAAKIHLGLLAQNSATAADDFRHLCLSPAEQGLFRLAFHLDHGTEPHLRLDFLSECARQGTLEYCLSRTEENDPDSFFSFHCQEVQDSISVTREPADFLFSRTMRRHLSSQLLGGNYVFLGGYHQDRTYRLELLRAVSPPRRLESLRSYLVRNTSEFDKELQGSFTKKERTRLAYELAECALLFLKTRWFSGLCSCVVYRSENKEFKACYLLAINQIRHVPPDEPVSLGDSRGAQWCEEELFGMHIRRLGVLLTEIALGKTVMDAVYNARAEDVEFDLDIDARNPGSTRIYGIRHVLNRVQVEASEDYRDAVAWCLCQDTPPERITTNHIGSFYDYVVAPLYRHYEKEIVEPARRLQTSRQSQVFTGLV